MDHYEEISLLGRGAAGTVYKVSHTLSKKLFALKKVRIDEDSNLRNSKSIQDEARILGKLRHPHIITLHGSFFNESGIYFCLLMDLCEGGTLDDKIKEAGKNHSEFAEIQIMHWFVQVTMAVQYLHSERILHRDLKTQNVFLTKRNRIIKLGDFGISKSLEHTMDLAATCCGTPCYIAPELCQDQPYSSKADVWSLGCLLYELCALEPAFMASNPMSLIYKIVKADYVPLPSRFSIDLRDLIRRLLLKLPEYRPSTSAILTINFVKLHLDGFIESAENLLCKVRKQQQQSMHLPDSSSSIYSSVLPSTHNNNSQAVNVNAEIEMVLPSTLDELYEDDFEVASSHSEGTIDSIHSDLDAEDYESDFEDCSEQENIDELLCTAKLVQEGGCTTLFVEEQPVVDTYIPNCSGRIKERCLDVLNNSRTDNDMKMACKNVMDVVSPSL